MVKQLFSKHPTEGYAVPVGTWISGVAYFTQRKDQHYYRNATAWGVDSDVFDSLPPDTKSIVIDYSDNGSKHRISVDFARFNSESWLYAFPGFNTRRFLEADKWDIGDGTGEKQTEMFGEGK